MFDPVFESLRKTTEMTAQLQQEMFKRWTSLFANVPTPGRAVSEQAQQWQRKWADFVTGTAKKQREVIEAQFKAGLRQLEEAFKLGEVKDPEELRIRTVEFWKTSFGCLRQTFEAQVQVLQATAGKWTELVTKGAA